MYQRGHISGRKGKMHNDIEYYLCILVNTTQFYVCWCFGCMYVYIPHECLVPEEARQGVLDPKKLKVQSL